MRLVKILDFGLAKLTDERRYAGLPARARDGRSLCYGSNRDGFYGIWAKRITDDGKPSDKAVGLLFTSS